jgi:hypothetical protein
LKTFILEKNKFENFMLSELFTIRRTSSKKLAEDDERSSFCSFDNGYWPIVDFNIEFATIGRVEDVGLGGRDAVGTVLMVVG